MIYLTSDWHLHHDREFIYEERGFKSIQEHDEAIIENLDILKPGDILYNLGDVCFHYYKETFQKIKGLLFTKYLIIGNHDFNNGLNKMQAGHVFDKFTAGDYIKHGDIYMLSHYPQKIDPSGSGGKMCSVHGHTHDKEKINEYGHINVCVDAWDMKPVPFTEIMKFHTDFINKFKAQNSTPE